EASQVHRALLGLDVMDPEAQYQHIRSEAAFGLPEAVVSLAEQLHRNDPSNARYRFGLAATYAKLGRYREALEPLEKSLAETPKHYEVNRLYAESAAALYWTDHWQRAARTMVAEEPTVPASILWEYRLVTEGRIGADVIDSFLGRALKEAPDDPDVLS